MRVNLSMGVRLFFFSNRRSLGFARNKLLAVVIFLSGALAANLSAQRQSSFRILGISVEGNKTADANFVKLSSRLSIGEQVTSDDIQAAIKQLWKLNMFE